MPIGENFEPIDFDLLRRLREGWLGGSVDGGVVAPTSVGATAPVSVATVPAGDGTLGTTVGVVSDTPTVLEVEEPLTLVTAVNGIASDIGETFGGVPVNLVYMFGGLVFLTILRR